MKLKDKRFWFGTAVSVAWLCWMGWQLYCVGLPKELNEQGDFFAGFFAPLAFLWLVLGYLQQGEELRQSTEALRLQAEELKNSVEQQSQLVDATRKQIEQDAEALKEERLAQHRRAQPVFTFTLDEGLSNGKTTAVRLFIKNSGQLARDVAVVQEERDGSETEIGAELHLPGGEVVVANAILHSEYETPITITYVDINSSFESITYWFGIVNGTPQMTSMLWDPDA